MTRTLSALLWFGLVITASLALYHTSDRVHELNEQLHQLNTSIESERQSIHVLKADWVYLANPERVEQITKRHLPLRPSSPQQVVTLSDVAEILPTRNEATASVTVNTTPLVTIHTTLAALPSHPLLAHKPVTLVASADTSHLATHMIMERAPTQDAHDAIGSLIADLGSRP